MKYVNELFEVINLDIFQISENDGYYELISLYLWLINISLVSIFIGNY